jgi:hypothetical protein
MRCFHNIDRCWRRSGCAYNAVSAVIFPSSVGIVPFTWFPLRDLRSPPYNETPEHFNNRSTLKILCGTCAVHQPIRPRNPLIIWEHCIYHQYFAVVMTVYDFFLISVEVKVEDSWQDRRLLEQTTTYFRGIKQLIWNNVARSPNKPKLSSETLIEQNTETEIAQCYRKRSCRAACAVHQSMRPQSPLLIDWETLRYSQLLNIVCWSDWRE